MSTALIAQHGYAATLDDVSYATLPGNQQQIAFKLSETVTNPLSFQIEQPAQIAIDLMDTTNALDKRVVPVGIGNVESVNIVEANDRTRVVLNLGEMTGYETEIDGDRLLVTLDSDAEGLLDDTGDETIPLILEPGQDDLPGNAAASNGTMQEIPSSLPLDYKAPETPADAQVIIDEQPGQDQQVNVETGADTEEYVEQTPLPTPTNQVVNRSPAFTGNDSGNFSGEELSLNFQDIEVRSVLQLLADFTDLNIVVSDSVSGKLTLRLKNVPWDQALDIILRTKGLDKRHSGNVVMVAPTGEIAAQETAEREAAQKAIELEPLRTEFVQVNYAKATEVAAILKSDSGGLLSDRGSVTIDDRTNTILVNDTSDVLGKVRTLVTRLDIPVRQVLIESRIVIATDDFNREMGVRFGVTRDTTNGDGEGGAITGNSNGVASLLSGGDLGLDRFNVNLPSINQAGSIGLAFAKLPFGTLLELELSAMQAEGRGEVISSPRVITANQREAYIEQGVEIPYLEASSSGAASISFRKAVLGLKVKPQITPDERIIMDLTVNKDTVGEVFGAGDTRVPSIDTREVNTQVLVANGETVVLGGIYEQTIIQQRDQVPFFGDLPLIGKLFQYNSSEDDKTELLVFVTPKIVNDGTSTTSR
ncbi:hypothetical protein AB833_30095 [Chromatiales bacterium (ex Bugula neritina AB1)]|nr:hypothetical protein AB833_30095 [Chromatiales bacterium (ex Bugula neritina AB1)]